MPSSCEMWMYKAVTSAVTKRALDGRGERFSIRLRKSFVSLMCGGRLLARGWIKYVMQAERWSDGHHTQKQYDREDSRAMNFGWSIEESYAGILKSSKISMVAL